MGKLSTRYRWAFKKHPWTPQEREFLRKNHATKSLAQLAYYLSRSKTAIKAAIRTQGLKESITKTALIYRNGQPKIKITTLGCWEWMARLNSAGYGECNGQYSMLAHRQVYMEVNGPIPKKLHLDHLCRNTKCVNPAHLEPLTPAAHRQKHKKRK